MAGLFFLPGSVQATYKRLQRPLYHPCNYTARTQKAFIGLYSCVSVDLPHSSAHNTETTQTAYTPPVSRRRAYRQAQHLHRYQIPPPRRTLYRPAQPPYYNKVYKGARVRPCYGSMPDSAAHCRPCQPGGGLDTSHARRLAIWHRSAAGRTGWHPPPGGAVRRQGRGGRSGTIDGYRRSSFRAFAR